MRKKVLLVSVCKEKLHESEFVHPLKRVLKENNVPFKTKHYTKLKKEDKEGISHIILCGTSLLDNDFLKNINLTFGLFDSRPLLGICAGMQIIGIHAWSSKGISDTDFNSLVKKKIEIGLYSEYFKKNFLGLEGNKEVYHLHQNYIDFSKLKDFEIYNSGKIPQAIKHRKKKIYGVLFHPEVRQKDLILKFLKI